MDSRQWRWTSGRGWDAPLPAGGQAALVLVFGGRDALEDGLRYAEVRAAFPDAHVVGCSTAGEIQGTQVTDDGVVATAVRFAGTEVDVASVEVAATKDSEDAGRRLGQALGARRGLRHVLVVSDGQKVNGSGLARGLQASLPLDVSVTGGLAGDGARFERTLVAADAAPRDGVIAAVGFYGDRIRVGYGSLGGWDSFGATREVTRSDGNVVFELDGKPALALYKEYLGERAADLPASGLLYPLSVRMPTGREVVRTILAVDEAQQSLTFAGEIPRGSIARLMKANFDRLVDGAQGAAEASAEAIGSSSPDLAILVSCVGRKLVLKSRVEEELDAVREVMGPQATLAGFYSYGEICPAAPFADCDLHNQTMTITTFRET